MPTETPNRPSRIGLEKCFPEREWPKTHIPLGAGSGPGRRRWTPPPRQAWEVITLISAVISGEMWIVRYKAL